MYMFECSRYISCIVGTPLMSLLCGCTSGTRSAQSTPSHTAAGMSKLRQPSTSSRLKFGYGGSQSKLPQTNSSAPNNHGDKQPCDNPQTASLDYGLALSPTALLAKTSNSGTGGYIPRKASQLKKNERPVSSIASINRNDNSNNQPVPVTRAVDDTNPTGKPKSGLRSFLARSFYRSKSIPKSQTIATLQTSSSPQLDGTVTVEAPIAPEEDITLDSPNSRTNSIKASASETSLTKYKGRTKSIVRPSAGLQKAPKSNDTSKTTISTVDNVSNQQKQESANVKQSDSDTQVTNKSGHPRTASENSVNSSRIRSGTSSTLSQSSLHSNQSGRP